MLKMIMENVVAFKFLYGRNPVIILGTILNDKLIQDDILFRQQTNNSLIVYIGTFQFMGCETKLGNFEFGFILE